MRDLKNHRQILLHFLTLLHLRLHSTLSWPGVGLGVHYPGPTYHSWHRQDGVGGAKSRLSGEKHDAPSLPWTWRRGAREEKACVKEEVYGQQLHDGHEGGLRDQLVLKV